CRRLREEDGSLEVLSAGGRVALVVSSSPRVARGKRGRARLLRHVFAGSRSGPSMERSGAASSAQSHDDDPTWGHADTRAVCWLRPSLLTLVRRSSGNGSLRREVRSTRG